MKRREFLSGISSAGVLGALGVFPAKASALDDLYSNRLLFDETGVPLLPVRLMEGQRSVHISSKGGMRVRVDSEQREQVLGPGELLEAGHVFGEPALIRELSVVETLEGTKRQERFQALARWQKRIADVQLHEVGGVYGVAGSVLDNRASLLVVPRALDSDEIQRWKLRPTSSEELLRLPGLGLDLRFPGGERRVGSAKRPAWIRIRPAKGTELDIQRVEHSKGYANHGYADRSFAGEVWLVPDRAGQIAVVNLVPESILVAGILPSEMFASAPMATLKAQAVTARGEIFAKVGRRHLGDPYLVCSAQCCQVYKGRGAEHPRTTKAAEETAGEMAFLNGKLVDSVYSACCGGHTEPGHIVWDRPPTPALMGRADAAPADLRKSAWRDKDLLDLSREEHVRKFLALPRELSFCGASTFNQKGDAFRWTRRFSRDDLNRYLEELELGEIQSLRVMGRGPGGRLRSLEIIGSARRVRIDRELPVRKRFGNLRSGLFVIDEERDERGTLLAVTFTGGGFGHGAGMCQQGAIGMAEAGYSYREILRHYYLGAEVVRIFR